LNAGLCVITQKGDAAKCFHFRRQHFYATVQKKGEDDIASDIDWDRYDDVLHEVYSAAVEPERWPEALRQITELFKASKANLFSFNIPDGRVRFQIAHNI
jgi:hypothetical protein